MRKFIAALTIVILYMTVLTGCGGGGGNGAIPTTVSGVAATGSPISNAIVSLMDNRGRTVTGTTDANGNYSLNIANLFYPYAIKVDWNDGTAHTLYSFARIPGNTANINPMTNTVVINASGIGDISSFTTAYFASADRSALRQVEGNLNLALSDIQTKLNALLTIFASTSTNPFSVNYAIGTLGLDKLFDLVAFEISDSNVTIKNRINSTVICSGLMNNVATWSVNASNIPNALGSIAIANISPSGGTVGDHIVITGTGFIANPLLNTTKIGNNIATVFAATSTSIEIVIPAGAISGLVTVKNVNGSAQSSLNLSVSNGSSYSYTLNQVVNTSGNIVISGGIFESGFSVEIKQGNTTYTVTTATITPTQIQFAVPNGFNASQAATIQVKNGSKVSNIYTLQP